MSAARKITHLAIGDLDTRAHRQTYDVHRFLDQKDRMSEALPFGSRGGIAIRHFFPLDAEYLIKIRLKRDFSGNNILGIAEKHQLDVRLDGSRIQLFTVGGKQHDNPAEYARTADAGLEVRLPVEAGRRVVGVTFLKQRSMPEGVLRPHLAGIGNVPPCVRGECHDRGTLPPPRARRDTQPPQDLRVPANRPCRGRTVRSGDSLHAGTSLLSPPRHQ